MTSAPAPVRIPPVYLKPAHTKACRHSSPQSPAGSKFFPDHHPPPSEHLRVRAQDTQLDISLPSEQSETAHSASEWLSVRPRCALPSPLPEHKRSRSPQDQPWFLPEYLRAEPARR